MLSSSVAGLETVVGKSPGMLLSSSKSQYEALHIASSRAVRDAVLLSLNGMVSVLHNCCRDMVQLGSVLRNTWTVWLKGSWMYVRSTLEIR